MKPNVGNVDSWIRIILGAVILFLGYYYQTWWGLIGLLPILTGIFRFCPAYWLFKFSTEKKTS